MISKIKKYIVIVITILLWVILLSQLKNIDVIMVKQAICIGMVILSTIHIWRIYNIKRFGKLNRRRFPMDATNNDVSKFFGLSVDEIISYQNEKTIVFENNIL
jgi:poly-beta-1,6-N-acetyl-D-glucosamine biosynthesis protein PgaD